VSLNVLCASVQEALLHVFCIEDLWSRRCELRTYDYWTKRTFLYRLKKITTDVVFGHTGVVWCVI